MGSSLHGNKLQIISYNRPNCRFDTISTENGRFFFFSCVSVFSVFFDVKNSEKIAIFLDFYFGSKVQLGCLKPEEKFISQPEKANKSFAKIAPYFFRVFISLFRVYFCCTSDKETRKIEKKKKKREREEVRK